MASKTQDLRSRQAGLPFTRGQAALIKAMSLERAFSAPMPLDSTRPNWKWARIKDMREKHLRSTTSLRKIAFLGPNSKAVNTTRCSERDLLSIINRQNKT